MFYTQETAHLLNSMMNNDVQDNQLIGEGKTVEYLINIDCNNEGSLSLSDDNKSLFQPNSDKDPSEDDDKQTIATVIRPACAWCLDAGIT